MQGFLKNVAHRSHFDQPTAVHHPDAIHKLRHKPHVVSHQQHGSTQPFLYRAQGVHDLPLHDHVQGTGRLIGNDKLRPQRDGHRNAHTLFHASTQLVGIERRHRFLEPHPF